MGGAILDYHVRSGGWSCIILPNFTKIGRSILEILQFFDFSWCRPPPSWIYEIMKFYWLTGSGDQDASSCRISSKLIKPLIHCGVIAIFQFFKMAALRHFGFVWGIFGLPAKGTWRSLSLWKIWLQSMQYFRKMKVWIFLHVWLENAYSRPKKSNGEQCQLNPQKHILARVRIV